MAKGRGDQLEGREVVLVPVIGRRVIGHVGKCSQHGFAGRAERFGRQPLSPALGQACAEQRQPGDDEQRHQAGAQTTQNHAKPT